MRKESFTYDRLSPAALQRVPDSRLAVLHNQLTARGNSVGGDGRSFLRGQLRKVTGELDRREQLTRSKHEPKESFKRRHTVLREEKSPTSLRGTIVEAHKDDISMAKIAKALSNAGVELTIVTLTDGAARGLTGYPREELPNIRWNEGKTAGNLAGATDMFGIDLPDGNLTGHHEDAINFLGDVQKKTRGDFMIAPNLLDEHPDHAAAHEIALAVAGEEIPVYGMDTITGFDMNGVPLEPDRYLVLPRRAARREKQIYLAHTSQVENIPPYERRAMMDVLGMTKRRGQEIGVPHAAVLFDPLNTELDPLTDVFAFKRN